jgi:hypothetical protein
MKTDISGKFRLLRRLAAMIIIAAIFSSSHSQSISPSQKASISLEIGNWQPQSLNESPVFSTFGQAGATPLFCGGFCLPLGKETGFRLSAGFWSLRDLRKVETVHSLTLHSVHGDFKYWLVPDFRLSAYVLYGAGVYWGVENESSLLGKRLSKAHPRMGVNLGGGVDIALSRRLGLGMVFAYHFIQFKEFLGGVEDFSGPKIGAAVYWFL